MTPVEERIDHEAETREIAESVVRTAETWNYDGKPVHYATFRLWIDYAARIARAYLDLLTEHSAREELIEQAICLADNAEAYLDLEAQGVKNYPDSLRLCIDGLRAVLPKESPCQ